MFLEVQFHSKSLRYPKTTVTVLPYRNDAGQHHDHRPCLLQDFVVLATISARGIGVQCRGFGGVQIRTVTCTTIMIANLCLVLTSRSGIDGENGFLVFCGVL